ncbi:sugar ABC transporter substrate-binding protein [Sediminibacillus halophilus]|uniref:Multiple sugar transport system substrate-binding protein n=1 Tax=Sediminibacillus halophilus TaxID=482461 RepID=A0A1G9UZG0_9BACI|nr:sugar ABC transporter substrate-binding protein [Sediminibacillus halophilus]SDM65249.1 multiple sugar transport system substrate-binding protein [Sediminibacillus halophilus]
MLKKGSKVFLFAIILVGAAFVLGACSNASSSSDDTLQVWTMSDELEGFVEDYEAEHDIEIEVQTIPWENAHDKLLTAVASGKGPDVLQIGTTWVAEFAEAGAFYDMSEDIGDYENLDLNNFFEGARGTAEYDDQVIGIPWYVDTRALFYRTDILEEVGYPDGPQTWDEMIDASQKLADRGDGQYAIDLPRTDPQFPFMLGWQQGWTYEVGEGSANFDDPAFKDAVDIYTTFYEEGYSQLEEGKEIIQAFSDGSKPMFFSGPWDIKTIKDNGEDIEGKWDVALMPEGETNKSMMGGAHLSIFHNSEKVDEALDFINWMADTDTQLAWYETMSELPANQAAWEDPILADDPMVSTFGEQLKSTEPLPLIPEYERMGNELLDTLEQIYRGGADTDEALANYRKEVDDILSE